MYTSLRCLSFVDALESNDEKKMLEVYASMNEEERDEIYPEVNPREYTRLMTLGVEPTKSGIIRTFMMSKEKSMYLFSTGIDLNFIHSGWTPLLAACSILSSSLVKNLISYGVDVNLGLNTIPLHSALFRQVNNPEKCLKITRALLEGGADPNITDWDERIAIFYARYVDIAELLLEKTIDINHLANGRNVLTHVNICGVLSAEMVRLFIARGVNVNHTCSNGETPLSINFYNANSFEALIDAGAEITVRVSDFLHREERDPTKEATRLRNETLLRERGIVF